jgi:hypothetical protein
MASESSPTPVMSWQFLVLIAATLGIVMNQASTLPLAPAARATKPPKARTGETVLTDSRLWADPYGEAPKDDAPKANAKAAGSPSAPGKDGPTLGPPDVGLKRLTKIHDGRICIMPVIVRADANSAEAVEMRIRFRIATASGLGAEGYSPDDPNHLMWVKLDMGDTSPGRVPVEWFLPGALERQRPPKYDAILVVWIRDTVLLDHPLKQLNEIREQLKQQLGTDGLIGEHPPAFSMIGPYWSGTLVDMVGENSELGKDMTFYSSSATMADGVLDLLAGTKGKDGQMGRDRLHDAKAGPVLENLTCTDEQLSESMIKELELRGIVPGAPNSRIVILSDWDTDFGRVLPLTFAAKYQQIVSARKAGVHPDKLKSEKFDRLTSEDFKKLKFDDAHSWPPQILRAYYLSGVEGNLKRDENSSGKASDDSKDAPGSSSSAVSLQRAEGEHQVDYIARLGKILAQRIEERDLTAGSRGKLDAIGILGTDVYDKLLLIQALRPLFKGAIFFTDSLDARFMDPVKAIPYTRNLVVSTSYGFDLFRNFQVGAPPFRSTEQTGAFLATQAAAAGDGVSLVNIQKQIRPLRFEIGRTYPVDLNIPGESWRVDPKNDLKETVDKFQGQLHPPLGPIHNPRAYALERNFRTYFLSIMAAGLFFFTIVFVASGHIPFSLFWKYLPWTIGLSALVLLGIVAWVCQKYDGIEPASWIQGVSIWPSEIIRLVAFALGAGCLYYGHVRVFAVRESLAQRFGITPPSKIGRNNRGFWSRVGTALCMKPYEGGAYVMTFADAQDRCPGLGDKYGLQSENKTKEGGDPAREVDPTEKFVVVESLWKEVCERSTFLGRNVRTAAMGLSFLVGWGCIAGATYLPITPYRGVFSRTCDHWALIPASIMLSYLMFWVVDETHLCLRFIQKLGSHELTLWPKDAYLEIPSLAPEICHEGVIDNAASSYIDVCFIGKMSREAVPLIIMPFLVLTLMIVARWDYFANWMWDPIVLAAYITNSAICVCCAIMLRNKAVDAKQRALRQISRAIAEARGASLIPRAEGLEKLRDIMDENMDGAFVPWHQQPFVNALLIPFGGSGGLALVEYLLSRP